MRRIFFTLPIVLLTISTFAQTPVTGGINFEPCRLAGWTEAVKCAQYAVPENRRKTGRGRTISLRIVVVPASEPKHPADPVFYFAGGPGGSAVDLLTRAGAAYLGEIRKDHDIVFVDQRGTGGSNPLTCELFNKDDMASYFDDVLSLDRMAKCRTELEKKADLRLYSTPIAMADIDDVRKAMGYDQIDLYGGSYGSTAALAYLKLYPQHVRAVAILGVAPPSARTPLQVAGGVENGLKNVFADCAADVRCHSLYPDPMADLKAAASTLERSSSIVQTTDPYTKKPAHITLTRPVFGELVRTMLYQTETSRWLPLVLHQAAAGNFAPIVNVGFQSFRAIEDLVARGMHFAVVCSEGVQFITDADARQSTANTFYGGYRLERYRQVCKDWPRSEVTKDFVTPFRSAAPVLMISGEADPVTPPDLGAALLPYFPNAKQIVVPHAGHSINSACTNSIAAAFLDSGTTKGLDTKCVEQSPRPGFITEDMFAVKKPVDKIAGEEVWEGTLAVSGQQLRLIVHLYHEDGKLKAYLLSPDQSDDRVPINVISYDAGKLHFEISLIGVTYDGSLSTNGVIKGRFKQGSIDLPLDFALQK